MSKPITLRVTDEMFEILLIASDRHNISLGAVVRECISATLRLTEKNKKISAYRPRYKYSRKLKGNNHEPSQSR